MKISNALICLFGLAASASAWATSPNTTAANSVPYEVGEEWVSHYYDETLQTRWFRFGEVAGHSYCVEAVQGSLSPIQLDPNLTVYTDTNGTTTLTSNGVSLSNDNGGGDPNMVKGARICYISPVTSFGTVTVRSVKVNVPITAASGDAGYVRLRITETTQVADSMTWYCPGCGVPSQAFTSFYVTNLGSGTLHYAVTLPAISQVGYYTGTMSAGTNATTYGYPQDTVNGNNVKGIVLIAHDGPPGTFAGYGQMQLANGTILPAPIRSK